MDLLESQFLDSRSLKVHETLYRTSQQQAIYLESQKDERRLAWSFPSVPSQMMWEFLPLYAGI
jgi:hypothetical protein